MLVVFIVFCHCEKASTNAIDCSEGLILFTSSLLIESLITSWMRTFCVMLFFTLLFMCMLLESAGSVLFLFYVSVISVIGAVQLTSV